MGVAQSGTYDGSGRSALPELSGNAAGDDPTFPWLPIIEAVAETLSSGVVRRYSFPDVRRAVLSASAVPFDTRSGGGRRRRHRANRASHASKIEKREREMRHTVSWFLQRCIRGRASRVSRGTRRKRSMFHCRHGYLLLERSFRIDAACAF